MSKAYPNFDDIVISTKTVIIKTTCRFNLKFLFENLPVSKFIVIPKKRGRKKEMEIEEDPNKNLKEGSIITLKFFDSIRGVNLKKPKKDANKKFFRNALSIVIKIDDKFNNFKLPSKGKIQMTGVKKNEQVIKCLKYLWGYMEKFDKENCYTLENPEDENIEIIANVVMTNIDFKLGFLVNRQNLDELFNILDNSISIFEPSYGYTGVNIKVPFNMDYNRELECYNYNISEKTWQHKQIIFSEYLDKLTPKEKTKEIEKKSRLAFSDVEHYSNDCK